MATKTTIHDVIEEFRQAPTNSGRGTKFENLMVEYFHLDPTLSVKYDEVYNWGSGTTTNAPMTPASTWWRATG